MIEIFKYGIIGALTTFLNIFIYFILRSVLNLNYILSSIIAWILALIFSFFANRNFVFEKKEKLKNKILKEFLFFAFTRYITGVLDIGIMVIGVEVFKQDDKLLKIISNIIGIILNYITSKFLIFKK